jgi:hypothetical protein
MVHDGGKLQGKVSPATSINCYKRRESKQPAHLEPNTDGTIIHWQAVHQYSTLCHEEKWGAVWHAQAQESKAQHKQSHESYSPSSLLYKGTCCMWAHGAWRHPHQTASDTVPEMEAVSNAALLDRLAGRTCHARLDEHTTRHIQGGHQAQKPTTEQHLPRQQVQRTPAS